MTRTTSTRSPFARWKARAARSWSSYSVTGTERRRRSKPAWPATRSGAAGNVRVNPETLAEGVTCVACHGPYLDWVRIHPESILLGGRVDANRPNTGRIGWIDLSREEKANQFGMTDLRDPIRRAETCASCHVGNHDQGKVVTHAMYAAGHPPLPGFETAAFSDAQPPHWQTFDKRTPERQSRFKPHDPRNLEQTQLVAVSGLVVVREWMKLFAAQAAVENPDPSGAPWPDLARFDCYACHHELQARDVVSWRQLRRRDGQPGRPAPPDWPLILVQLGIDLADPKLAGAENPVRATPRRVSRQHEGKPVRQL